MEENKVSWTALLAAYTRGYHTAIDRPKVFNDPLAFSLLSEEERRSLEQQIVGFIKGLNPEGYPLFPNQAAVLAWFMQLGAGAPLALGRARWAEDRLEEAAGQGMKQYVNLGAGLDTFAFRCPELVEKLQVFEVDHPGTQAFKRKRLTDLGWEIPSHLHFVPVDFTKESLVEALQATPFDPLARTFFSWLGVTYYLPGNAVLDTLRSITEVAPAGSMILFDYLDTDAFNIKKASTRVVSLLGLAQREGEPMNFGFDPETLDAELAPLGLRLQEDLNPFDIQQRYFLGRADYYHACEHAHYACAVVE